MLDKLNSHQDLVNQLYHSHGRLLRHGSKVLYVTNGDIVHDSNNK